MKAHYQVDTVHPWDYTEQLYCMVTKSLILISALKFRNVEGRRSVRIGPFTYL